jgi:hypothetical protein
MQCMELRLLSEEVQFLQALWACLSPIKLLRKELMMMVNPFDIFSYFLQLKFSDCFSLYFT